MVRKRRWDFSCFRDERNRCLYAVFFGIGMTVSCFCPKGLVLFLAAIIIVALGVHLLWCC